MSLIKNTPVSYKDYVPANFSSFIDDFFKDTNEIYGKDSVLNFNPKVDIAETEKQYEISLQLAGMNKEDIKIDFHEGKLIVSGERKFEKKEEGKKFLKIETQFGSFHRTFALPEKTNHELIEADYNNGILNIVIPKEDKKTNKTSIVIK
ncbi:MAG: Hsp20/alpha crystallin family protein [Cytophagales bacterium]|nr:MAG: Hsp20/alpha crystallin family protein [Cytophagales bacterium]